MQTVTNHIIIQASELPVDLVHGVQSIVSVKGTPGGATDETESACSLVVLSANGTVAVAGVDMEDGVGRALEVQVAGVTHVVGVEVHELVCVQQRQTGQFGQAQLTRERLPYAR